MMTKKVVMRNGPVPDVGSGMRKYEEQFAPIKPSEALVPEHTAQGVEVEAINGRDK